MVSSQPPTDVIIFIIVREIRCYASGGIVFYLCRVVVVVVCDVHRLCVHPTHSKYATRCIVKAQLATATAVVASAAIAAVAIAPAPAAAAAVTALELIHRPFAKRPRNAADIAGKVQRFLTVNLPFP